MHVSKLIKHLARPVRSAGLVRDVVQLRRQVWKRKQRVSRLLAEGSNALARMPAPENPVGLVPLMHCGFYNDASAYVGLAVELLRRNWQPIWVHGDIRVPFAAGSPFAEFNGGLRYHSRHEYSRTDGSPGKLQNDWVVDFPNERAVCEGNDYFLLIAGKLRRTFKCFDLDWDDPDVQARAAETLHSADAAHSYCDALFEKAKQTGLPVRFIGAEHLYIPSGIPMLYSKYLKEANAEQAKLFEFIDFGGAYAHFFSDGEYHTRSQFSVQNVTRHDTFSRHEVLLPDFESWLADHQKNDDNVAFGKRLLKQKWTGSDEVDPQANDALERIAAVRKKGGKAAWLFGHAVVELGNPSDFGAVHPTLKDWIASSVEAIRGTETLLVIKPHPAEARYKPNRRPNQLFRDLFDFPLPDNIVFLDPLWAPLNKILPLVDIGIAWRGSAGAQLMMEGVPVVVCGMHTAYHHILHPPQPRDLDDYKAILLDPERVQVDAAQQRRSALYFSYMRDRAMHAADFLLPPQQITVDGFSYLRDTLVWDYKKLDAIISAEVESISKMCDTICA